MTPEEQAKLTRLQDALGTHRIPDMPQDEFKAKFLALLEDPEVQARMAMLAKEHIFAMPWRQGPRTPYPVGPLTLGAAEYLRVTDTASCPCGKVTVTFDPTAARGLNAHEVRKLWPRGQCQDCKAIVYASNMHYVSGDW